LWVPIAAQVAWGDGAQVHYRRSVIAALAAARWNYMEQKIVTQYFSTEAVIEAHLKTSRLCVAAVYPGPLHEVW